MVAQVMHWLARRVLEFYAREESGSARGRIVVRDERDIAFQELSAIIAK